MRYADAGTTGQVGPEAEEEGSNDEWQHPHNPDARIMKMRHGNWHDRGRQGLSQQESRERSDGGVSEARVRTYCSEPQQGATVLERASVWPRRDVTSHLRGRTNILKPAQGILAY